MTVDKRRAFGLMVIVGLTMMTFVPPYSSCSGGNPISTQELVRSRADRSAWPWNLTVPDESELMAQLVDQMPAEGPSTVVPYNYRHTFNFSNSEHYFGELAMTREEVDANLRNYMFQLLYGDVEAACEVSVLDVMLLRVFDSLIVDWLDIGFEGFCNGMAQASRDYYLNPASIPLGRDYAYLLPAPSTDPKIAEETGGDVTESAIKEYVLWKGSGAFFNPNHLLNWVKIYLGLPAIMGGTTNRLELGNLMAEMMLGVPQYKPVVLLLMAPYNEASSATESHFVTAYDYTKNANGSVTVYIYNNWEIYSSTSGMYEDWILIHEDGTFKATHHEKDKLWSRMCVYTETSEYNSILTTLMSLLDDLLSVLVLSPVDIEVTDPLGRKVSINGEGERTVEFPAIAVEHGGQKEILMPYVPGLPYQLKLSGTDEGSYAVEFHRYAGGELVTERIEGNTTSGDQDIFSLSVEGAGIDVARQGVILNVPTLLSSSSLQLDWSQYAEPDFDHYEILVSTSLEEIGDVHATITDVQETSYSITGLKPEMTYFFAVRVVTSEGYADSNLVGATMPSETNYLLWIAVGAGVAALVIIVVFACKRR